MKFYCLAINQNGAEVVIELQSDLSHRAVEEAHEYCRQHGLIYEDVHKVQGSEKQPETLTKYYKDRKGKKMTFVY